MTEANLQDVVLPNLTACWELLERIAESPQLRRSARLRELLFYVGRRSLKEGCQRIQEHEIGVEVFGRPAGYDTNVDNIVRSNATELRKRIEAYFETDGVAELLIIEIPRGSYIPVFRYRSAATAMQPPASVQTQPNTPDGDTPSPPPLASSLRRPSALLERTVFASVILALAVLSLVFWTQDKSLRRAVSPWRFSPSLAALWSGFLDGKQDTDIVLEDPAFLLVQNIDRQTFTVDDYLRRTFLGQIERQNLSPDNVYALNLIWSKKFDRASDVELAMNILALDRLSKNLHLYNARDYSTNLLARNDVILLGNPTTNPWDQIFEDQLNFRETPESRLNSLVTNRTPAAGEQSVYTSTDTVSYCVIAYLPKPSHSGNLLMIQGTTSEATQAGGDFLISEDRLSDLRNRMHTDSFPYFELLLKVSHVQGMPIATSIETYRLYPNLK